MSPLALAVRACGTVGVAMIVAGSITTEQTQPDRSARIAEPAPGGGTRLYDAVALATVDRLRQDDRRKALGRGQVPHAPRFHERRKTDRGTSRCRRA